MSYVQSNGVRIHYEVEGQGSPLVMIHGWSWSIGDFYEYGWVRFRDSYELILIIAGHGYSDKPHEVTAYGQRLMVQDVINVMDALSISQASYLGASMGGMIGLSWPGMLPRASKRCFWEQPVPTSRSIHWQTKRAAKDGAVYKAG